MKRQNKESSTAIKLWLSGVRKKTSVTNNQTVVSEQKKKKTTIAVTLI